MVGCLGLVLAALSSGRLMRTAWHRRKVGSCWSDRLRALLLAAAAAGCCCLPRHTPRADRWYPRASWTEPAPPEVNPYNVHPTPPHPIPSASPCRCWLAPPHPARPPRQGRSRRRALPFCGMSTTAARRAPHCPAARARSSAWLRRRPSRAWRRAALAAAPRPALRRFTRQAAWQSRRLAACQVPTPACEARGNAWLADEAQPCFLACAFFPCSSSVQLGP